MESKTVLIVSSIFGIFAAVLIVLTVIGKIKIELLTILLTLLTASYGYFFTLHLQKSNERDKEIADNIINSRKLKTEIYEQFMESLSNYILRNTTDETYKKYQLGRLKLCFYANDETVRALYSLYKSSVKSDIYKISDPVSRMLYAMRKEVNPSTNIEPEEHAGIDPFQWTGEIFSHKRE
jgi:hypothetical protein